MVTQDKQRDSTVRMRRDCGILAQPPVPHHQRPAPLQGQQARLDDELVGGHAGDGDAALDDRVDDLHNRAVHRDRHLRITQAGMSAPSLHSLKENNLE